VQAGLDLCWSQTHYVGFVMARLNFIMYTLLCGPDGGKVADFICPVAG
jgi:hypothetical protein